MQDLLVLHLGNLFLVGDHDGNPDLLASGDLLGHGLEGILNLGRSASTLGLAAATVSLTLACAVGLVAAA